jgi:hypothetical protein
MESLNRLKSSLDAQAADAKPVPYVACYRSPLSLAPDQLVGTVDGLQAIQDVHLGGGETAFVTFWASSTHHERASERMTKELGATATLLAGPAGALELPSKPWYQRIKLTTAVLSVAALFGALEVISNRYERIFAAPELALRSDKQVFTVVESEDIATSFTVESLLPVAEHRDIAVSASLVDAKGNSTDLKVLDPQMSSLTATKSRVFNVVAKAPSTGAYKMHFDVKAKAGWLRGERVFSTEASLTSWPQKPKGHIALKTPRPTNADFIVFADVGSAAPHGVACDLTLSGPGSVTFNRDEWRSVEATTLGKYLQAGTGESAIARLRWAWPVAAMQRRLTAEMTLTGEVNTNWSLLQQRARVDCVPLKEKEDAI